MAEEEREKKSKKKKALELPKEKRLQYYSGWGRGNSSKKEDKQETKSKTESKLGGKGYELILISPVTNLGNSKSRV